MFSAILFTLAVLWVLVVFVLEVAAPKIHPYYRVYGCVGNYKPSLYILAFAVAAKLVGF